MKKIKGKFVLFLLLLVGISLSLSTQTKAQTTNVKVGLLTPMTGELSTFTLGFEQGAQLAIDHLNSDPSINSIYDFTLIKYDTKTEPTGASAAMTKAVVDGVSYVVGAAGSSNTLAAAAIAVTNKIPLISYASTSPFLTTFDDHAILGDHGYLWRIPPSDALQGEVIADLAYDGNSTNMVILTLNNAYGAGLASSTKAEFELLGGSSTIITYSETTVDFSTIVTQIRSENPDIVVAISYATDGSLLFVEMADQDLNVHVIGADGVADISIFGETDGTQEAMQGFVTIKPIAIDTPEGKAFDEAYSEAFVNSFGHIYNAEAYDAIWAGALAIVSEGSVAGEDIINGLANINWDGVTGPVSFDQNGDSNAGFYQISEVQLAQMERVGTWNVTNGINYEDILFHDRWILNSSQSSATTTVIIGKTTDPIDTASETTSTIILTPTSNDEKTSDNTINLPFSFYGLILSISVSTSIIRFKRKK